MRTELGGEIAYVLGRIRRPVVREPLDRLWRPQNCETPLKGLKHQVTDLRAADSHADDSRQAMISP